MAGRARMLTQRVNVRFVAPMVVPLARVAGRWTVSEHVPAASAARDMPAANVPTGQGFPGSPMAVDGEFCPIRPVPCPTPRCRGGEEPVPDDAWRGPPRSHRIPRIRGREPRRAQDQRGVPESESELPLRRGQAAYPGAPGRAPRGQADRPRYRR